jgi:hypothetical protein
MLPLLVDFDYRSWLVDDEESLTETLAMRDSRGGAEFWLAHGDREFPRLAIRVTGDIADVIFFPKDDHPGFR